MQYLLNTSSYFGLFWEPNSLLEPVFGPECIFRERSAQKLEWIAARRTSRVHMAKNTPDQHNNFDLI